MALKCNIRGGVGACPRGYMAARGLVAAAAQELARGLSTGLPVYAGSSCPACAPSLSCPACPSCVCAAPESLLRTSPLSEPLRGFAVFFEILLVLVSVFAAGVYVGDRYRILAPAGATRPAPSRRRVGGSAPEALGFKGAWGASGE